MSLTDEKYVSFTTYRRDGTPVATPVWLVPLGEDRIGFWTSSASGKAKRLARDDRVTVQPCDARGRVKETTTPIAGTAHLVAGAEFDEIHRRVVAKYGFMTKITKALGIAAGIVRRKRIPYGDRGVIVTLAR